MGRELFLKRVGERCGLICRGCSCTEETGRERGDPGVVVTVTQIRVRRGGPWSMLLRWSDQDPLGQGIVG